MMDSCRTVSSPHTLQGAPCLSSEHANYSQTASVPHLCSDDSADAPDKPADSSDTALQLDGASLKVPDGVPIYDLQTDIPWFFEAQAPYTDLVQRTLDTDPELVKLLLAPEHPKAHPEAKSILRWETNMVRAAPSP